MCLKSPLYTTTALTSFIAAFLKTELGVEPWQFHKIFHTLKKIHCPYMQSSKNKDKMSTCIYYSAKASRHYE